MSLIAALATVGTTISLGALSGTAAAILGGVAVGGTAGAGIGAIKAAASGEDVGKGALMGGVGGAVTGGVAPGLGSAVAAPLTSAVGSTATGAVIGGVAGAAGGAAGAAAGGEDVGKGAMIGGASGAVTGGVAGASGGPPNVAGEYGTVNPDFSSVGAAHVSPSGDVGSLGDLGSLSDSAASGISKAGVPITGDQLSTGLNALGAGAVTDYAGQSIVDAQDAADKAAEEDKMRGLGFANQGDAGLAAVSGAGLPTGSGPLGSLGRIGRATGGLTALAHGGQIPLKDGAYIIPADVVSALGNGSSKAGAEFLRHLMMEVRKEAVGRQGIGAAKNHVT